MLSEMTGGHGCIVFLIFLAKRFNTAYYLVLDTGIWSGGENQWLVDVC
jgi:hypothetical protein